MATELKKKVQFLLQ